MRLSHLGFALALSSLLGCGGFRPVWHDQQLPSGRTVKVTSFHLVWGVEHDERRADDDCFALEYVSTDPLADAAVREQEALEVFELIRPVSELWGFDSATLAGFKAPERKGRYDLYLFTRGADGRWRFERRAEKVFVND